MTELRQLRQRYLEDGRPAVVEDVAIAALPSGELTDVINKAFALDRTVADEINCIYLNSFLTEHI